MQRLMRTMPGALIVLCPCLFLLMGCDTIGFSSSPPAATPHFSTPVPIASTPVSIASVHGSFVGKVTSTDDTKNPEVSYDTKLFIGFVTDGKKILGCLTDGTEQRATLFYWFIGEIKNGAADLQSTPATPGLPDIPPEEMHVTLTPDAITGTLRLSTNAILEFPNQYRLDFHAPLVASTGNAGVYRAKTTFENASYTAGWIVLPDGQQRGAAASLVESGPGDYGQVIRILPIAPGTTKALVVHEQKQEVPLEHLQSTSIFQPV